MGSPRWTVGGAICPCTNTSECGRKRAWLLTSALRRTTPLTAFLPFPQVLPCHQQPHLAQTDPFPHCPLQSLHAPPMSSPSPKTPCSSTMVDLASRVKRKPSIDVWNAESTLPRAPTCPDTSKPTASSPRRQPRRATSARSST